MKLKPDGILIEMTKNEVADVKASYGELCWHMQNLLACLGSATNNKFTTSLYCEAISSLISSYEWALSVGTWEIEYRKPRFREDVELDIKDRFQIDYAADILPRHKVRGVASGNGTFELKEDAQ